MGWVTILYLISRKGFTDKVNINKDLKGVKELANSSKNIPGRGSSQGKEPDSSMPDTSDELQGGQCGESRVKHDGR